MLKRATLPADAGPATQDRDSAPDLDEARIRQALDKLSGGASRSPRTQGGPSAGFGAGKPARHRYVQDGEVIVEHAAVHKRRGPEGSAPPAAHDPRLAETQAQLAAERTLRERAERTLERAQVGLREIETRLGHSEAALREARELSAKREIEMESLRATLAEHAARVVEPQPDPTKEPEPVKWWLNSKPSPKPARRTARKE